MHSFVLWKSVVHSFFANFYYTKKLKYLIVNYSEHADKNNECYHKQFIYKRGKTDTNEYSIQKFFSEISDFYFKPL